MGTNAFDRVDAVSGVRPGGLPQGRLVLAIGQWICFVIILFASGDVWPSLSLGFNFRLSQLMAAIAFLLLPLYFNTAPVRLFPGWRWMLCFLLWIVACLPLSMYPERSLGYVMFAATDALILFVFVQYFRTDLQIVKLIRYSLVAFLALSVFGLLQFFVGLFGISLFTKQWWLTGRLARVNGLSYEPSYYATYLIAGWVLSAELLGHRAVPIKRSLVLCCYVVSTLALILSSSRIGWLVMLMWVGIWSLARARALARAGRLTPKLCMLSAVALAAILFASSLLFSSQLERIQTAGSQIAFLANGITDPTSGEGSTGTRFSELMMTWNAFVESPLIGTGIGALPVSIGAQKGNSVLSLDEAKLNEGMSIFVELLASTGIVGAVLMSGFGISVFRSYRMRRGAMEEWQRVTVRACVWSLVAILVALQLNQNFLRVYLFVDLGVLLCAIGARPDQTSPSAESRCLDHAVG